MLRAVSSCLIFLYLVDNGFASSGSLMPDDSDDSDYDVGQNNEKLVIYFQEDCASTREEALVKLLHQIHFIIATKWNMDFQLLDTTEV